MRRQQRYRMTNARPNLNSSAVIHMEYYSCMNIVVFIFVIRKYGSVDRKEVLVHSIVVFYALSTSSCRSTESRTQS